MHAMQYLDRGWKSHKNKQFSVAYDDSVDDFLFQIAIKLFIIVRIKCCGQDWEPHFLIVAGGDSDSNCS